MDVCGKDYQLDSIFWEQHGPKNESSISFFKRYFKKFCDSLTNPKKYEYNSKDIYDLSNCVSKESLKTNSSQPFEITEFQIYSQNLSLHTCLWKMNDKINDTSETSEQTDIKNEEKDICIIYMHTNTRSICDAKEIFPLAKALNASVLAFDLPGCGKSQGYNNNKIINNNHYYYY